MVVLVSLLVGAAHAEIDDATIVKALEEYLQASRSPFPMPPEHERARLLEGKVLKERIKDAKGDLAVGMILSEEPLRDLWLGSLDPHFDNVKNVRSYLFTPPPDAVTRWYGLVDLPFPFNDRHFLITTVLNKAMAEATAGRIWERTWNVDPDGVAVMEPIVAAGKVEGVDSHTFARAIYTPVNHGSWFLVQLDATRVLLGYSCATVIGGDIPDGLVTQHVLAGLDELLTKVVSRAGTIAEHYKTGHDLLVGGDGIPIPPAN
jgi:hypothetical protein